MTALPLLAIPTGAILIWLVASTISATAKRNAARQTYFSALSPLFDRMTSRVQPSGFSRVTGVTGEHAFDLQALTDSLTFRKLPALWVMLTLPGPLPVRATIDIMARPGGLETFSRFSQLPHSLPRLAGLPEHVAIRTDDATTVVDPRSLTRHLGLFDDPAIKELVIAPTGIRIVFLAEEAERGRYLIFRDAELGGTPLGPGRVAPLIDAILALRQTLIEEAA